VDYIVNIDVVVFGGVLGILCYTPIGYWYPYGNYRTKNDNRLLKIVLNC